MSLNHLVIVCYTKTLIKKELKNNKCVNAGDINDLSMYRTLYCYNTNIRYDKAVNTFHTCDVHI